MNIGITCYPTVGRLRRRGGRARQAARAARPHGPLHLLPPALPPRRLPREHLLPRGRRLVLRALRVPAPRPRPGRQDGRGRRASTSSTSSTSTTRSPTPSPASWPSRCSATSAPKLVTTLHGTDITLVGQDRSFFEITRFGIERSDGVTAVSEFLRKMTLRRVPDQEAHRGRSRTSSTSPSYCAAPRLQGPRRVRDARARRSSLHVSNFRPVKRVLDVVRILERVAREVAGGAAHGRRGPRALLGPGPGPPPRARRPRALPRDAGERRGDRRAGRRVPAPVGARVLRPLGPRGHGLRRAGGGLRRGRPARGRAARRDRLPAAGRRRRGHGRRAPSRS